MSAKVLLAGTFDPEFARNRVLVSLLRREGFDVRVARRELWGNERHLLVDQSKLRLASRATTAYPQLAWQLSRIEQPDLLLVPYPGYFDVPLVAAIARARRIPLLFDTFISLYDTVVEDRSLRGPRSVVGRAAHAADTLACRLADLVLVDTPAHADYFAEATGVDRGRFRVLWLGAREDIFRPQIDVAPLPNRVLFHGTFVPLQGLTTIIEAAKLLEPDGVQFRIVGDGQERRTIDGLVRSLDVRNVTLTGRVAVDEVPREIAAAALCLGIFGTSAKASRVIPNKVFECLAVGRPVLTGNTPAIRAAFAGELATVPVGDPAALAVEIRSLLSRPEKLASLAAAGLARYQQSYSEARLGSLLHGYVDELVRRPAGLV